MLASGKSCTCGRRPKAISPKDMQAKATSLLGRVLKWRARHLSQQQFMLILAVLVGFFVGLVAVSLKNMVHFIQHLMHADFLGQYFNLYYFIFPVVGIGITVLISRLLGGRPGEGIPIVLYYISKRSGLMKAKQMFSWLVTSLFTAGFGGSVGLEGPSVGTGAAIGSNLGRVMHLNFKNRILLLSCASAGVLAAVFNAPIAAIIFTIEIFSLDLTMASLVPLLLASVSGAVTSIFLQGNDYLFHYKSLAPFVVEDVPFYIMLGICTALASVYFTQVYFYFDRFFKNIKGIGQRWLIGSLGLGLLIWLIPPLYGEGYETINHLLNGEVDQIVSTSMFYTGEAQGEFLLIALLLGLVAMKILAASFTFGAGGVGGVFAPSLFVGCSLGFVFARIASDLGIADINSTNFALVGMGGLMAGVLHSPLTAIFMIAEITGGYELFIPLMIVSAISYLVTKRLLPHSIYTKSLAKTGELLTHNKDQVVLALLRIDSVVERDFKRVKPEMTLGELVKVVSTSHRNLFPVLDEAQQLVGVLTLDDFRHIMFDQSLYDNTYVSSLMNPPPAKVDKNASMSQVMKKFQDSGAWNLPVIDNKGKYVGFVSKSKLFSVYRRKLLEFS